ncbi:MAG: hypothetical protein M1113_04945 [Candidatus Thermoplasmatota archaeon]|nr:hypothetical protein [Candidatus Thermoplasmatota archaeon]
MLTIVIFVFVELLSVQSIQDIGNNFSPFNYNFDGQLNTLSSHENSTLTGSARTPSGVLSYIPVVVDNTHNESTQVPFDLEVKVDSYALRSLESNSLGNVIWFSLNGSVIPSWIQCNASSSSNRTIYWLKLSNPIPADFSTTVFMGFDNISVNNFANGSGEEGEAPQLSNLYGEYDNGNTVFPFYCNFSGYVLPSKWISECSNSGHISVNNSLIINESHNSSVAYAITNLPINTDYIFESLVSYYNESGGHPLIQGIGMSTSKFLHCLKFNNSLPVEFYFQNSLRLIFTKIIHATTN